MRSWLSRKIRYNKCNPLKTYPASEEGVLHERGGAAFNQNCLEDSDESDLFLPRREEGISSA